jgi:hypothetical protein
MPGTPMCAWQDGAIWSLFSWKSRLLYRAHHLCVTASSEDQDTRRMTNPVTVEVTRGARVESWHRGAVIAVDGDGKIIFSQSAMSRLATFPRSACKAMQALPLVESGAADAYGFGDKELALACSSHNGEDEHVALAASMLAQGRARCRDARMRRSLVVEPEGADPSGPHHGQADGAPQQLLRQAFRLRLHLRPPGRRSEGLCWL